MGFFFLFLSLIVFKNTKTWKSFGYWRDPMFTELYSSFFKSFGVTHKIKIPSLEMSQVSFLTLNKAFFLHSWIFQLSINKMRKIIFHLLLLFSLQFIAWLSPGISTFISDKPSKQCKSFGFFSPCMSFFQTGFHWLD